MPRLLPYNNRIPTELPSAGQGCFGTFSFEVKMEQLSFACYMVILDPTLMKPNAPIPFESMLTLFGDTFRSLRWNLGVPLC